MNLKMKYFKSFIITSFVISLFLLYFTYPKQESAVPIGGPFELYNTDEQKVKNSDFHGKYMLVYFGYTFCPDICPTALENITGALKGISQKTLDQIVPIFITIDPERDTLKFLKKYQTMYHPKITMLRGTPEKTEIAKKNYRVYGQKTIPVTGQKEYLIDHSSIIYLMGKNGEFLAHFSHGTPSLEIINKINEIIK
jgi:cytochrome oxidase Cu insertion factor (SCO1/SenC/PrrC family)